MKVLVGVDGSPNSYAAVRYISRLLSPSRDALALFFATPQLSFDDELLDANIQERARSAVRLQTRACAGHSEAGAGCRAWRGSHLSHSWLKLPPYVSWSKHATKAAEAVAGRGTSVLVR